MDLQIMEVLEIAAINYISRLILESIFSYYSTVNIGSSIKTTCVRTDLRGITLEPI